MSDIIKLIMIHASAPRKGPGPPNLLNKRNVTLRNKTEGYKNKSVSRKSVNAVKFIKSWTKKWVIQRIFWCVK
jgi:hypothetical protein